MSADVRSCPAARVGAAPATNRVRTALRASRRSAVRTPIHSCRNGRVQPSPRVPRAALQNDARKPSPSPFLPAPPEVTAIMTTRGRGVIGKTPDRGPQVPVAAAAYSESPARATASATSTSRGSASGSDARDRQGATVRSASALTVSGRRSRRVRAPPAPSPLDDGRSLGWSSSFASTSEPVRTASTAVGAAVAVAVVVRLLSRGRRTCRRRNRRPRQRRPQPRRSATARGRPRS